MTAAIAVAAFLAGALVSLTTSWLLVSRLERIGERVGLSEALLGVAAALAADAPEITSAVTAMASGERRLGAGVVIGSNVFNLAALLGLGAVVAGRIGLHRKVVLLGGTVAVWVAAMCLLVALGLLPPVPGCLLGLAALSAYVVSLGLSGRRRGRLRLPLRWAAWLESAVAEEEAELEDASRPAPGRRADVAIAAGALVVVVGASVTMERAASVLGSRFAIPEIVVGGLVLAAVTSLPNAVAAVYLAARGRGAASFSTALNSNALNVVAGLLLPAAVIGLGRPSGQTALAVVWYVGLTIAALACAYRDRGLSRASGILIIVSYVVFAVSVLGLAYYGSQATAAAIAAGLAVAAVFAAHLGTGRRPWLAGRPGLGLRQPSLLSGWPVSRLWLLSLGLPLAVSAVDAALRGPVVLIGLLIAGPCCAVLTGRWVPAALTGLSVTGLAILLSIADGIWDSAVFFLWTGAVVIVAVVSTLAAAAIQRARPRPSS